MTSPGRSASPTTPLWVWPLVLGWVALSSLLHLSGGPGQTVTGVQPPWPTTLGLAGYLVTLLHVPALLWAASVVVGRQASESARQFAVTAALLLGVGLRLLGRAVSDLAQGRPLDTYSAVVGLLAIGALLFIAQRRRQKLRGGT
ncbi:hypothetical protein [Deinococcus petrolearius]|uniref:Uncharacterized protein n=1 Tax=Deinococcus petrolearius TaxID=1751295 RepID=A0ABW1DHE0_9DEIO